MTIADVTKDNECCCSCTHNKRTFDKDYHCTCTCELDGHYIIGDIWELTGAEIREVINSQPTIQPEPLQPWEVLAAQAVLSQPAEPKRGRWILDRSGAYCCSKCMEPCATYAMMKPRDKFCKMCGSRNEVTE